VYAVWVLSVRVDAFEVHVDAGMWSYPSMRFEKIIAVMNYNHGAESVAPKLKETSLHLSKNSVADECKSANRLLR
jgi:hypothetical protein